MIPYTLMLLAHCMGDYYLQPAFIAKLKSKNAFYVLIHTSVYAAVMFATYPLYKCREYLIALVVSTVTHALIDIIKQFILNSRAKTGVLTVREERMFYLVDQVLHMAIILCCSFIGSNGNQQGELAFLSVTVRELTGMSGYALIGIATALLAVMKPANVFIQKVLITDKPDKNTVTKLKYGGKLGDLERLISMVMLLLGQYAAIALVFTAKSIVRYRDFEDRSFAEYYLYGTMLSVVVCICVFGLLKLFGCLP